MADPRYHRYPTGIEDQTTQKLLASRAQRADQRAKLVAGAQQQRLALRQQGVSDLKLPPITADMSPADLLAAQQKMSTMGTAPTLPQPVRTTGGNPADANGALIVPRPVVAPNPADAALAKANTPAVGRVTDKETVYTPSTDTSSPVAGVGARAAANPGTTAMAQTPYGTAGVKFVHSPSDTSWHPAVMSAYPEIAKAGTPENKAFSAAVQDMQKREAANPGSVSFDPMALAKFVTETKTQPMASAPIAAVPGGAIAGTGGSTPATARNDVPSTQPPLPFEPSIEQRGSEAIRPIAKGVQATGATTGNAWYNEYVQPFKDVGNYVAGATKAIITPPGTNPSPAIGAEPAPSIGGSWFDVNPLTGQPAKPAGAVAPAVPTPGAAPKSADATPTPLGSTAMNENPTVPFSTNTEDAEFKKRLTTAPPNIFAYT